MNIVCVLCIEQAHIEVCRWFVRCYPLIPFYREELNDLFLGRSLFNFLILILMFNLNEALNNTCIICIIWN